ncbi:hypothetical protein J4404_01540 [Candidatus Woesearchaeota archaeon]|nr:hypothetical protein [Candidatus Woesearchaeota archaeon]
MIGNPSQEKKFDERVIKAVLMEKIEKYAKTRNPRLKGEIEREIKNCFEQDINVSDLEKAFKRLVNQKIVFGKVIESD